ncbi:hypothetical protein [Paenibacillus spongiae]|uniref:DUF3592 domain-containing protein n=1 Tax=Paenibacillus spongiae TaxID=2909671 RepID=A0ABY5SE98_9BACL|nr:hypothetical protein [Paenibacillus spongiae]UVI31853.1 hypothetical protein L1F29_08570 [Paenibacillus spongiae]
MEIRKDTDKGVITLGDTQCVGASGRGKAIRRLLFRLFLLGHALLDEVAKLGEVSDNRVEKEQIGSIIGKVTSFSGKEGTYSGNFSNHYPKGTEYYNIKGVDKNEAIAIKIKDGSFIKANYEGEYAGSTFDWGKVLWYIAGLFLLVLVILIVKNNWK